MVIMGVVLEENATMSEQIMNSTFQRDNIILAFEVFSCRHLCCETGY